MKQSNLSAAVSHINRHGALLVFPMKDRELPLSLWKCFYPRSKMDWDWSETGDNRVADLWHLRTQLSTCRKVVYSKWFQGRATVFSHELFTAILSLASTLPDPLAGLPPESAMLASVLDDDSPLATKQLKAITELVGKEGEAGFTRGLKGLWSRLLAVGYGEVEEGGFPSLAIGSTKLLFEDLWDESREYSPQKRETAVRKFLANGSPLLKQYERLAKALASPPTG